MNGVRPKMTLLFVHDHATIARVIPRRIQPVLEARLDQVPVVVLTGPRQAGKTTLALEVAQRREALYLDLESERDRARLAAAELYLEAHLDRLVVLDEVHRMPELFSPAPKPGGPGAKGRA
jgi:predicted AAA+ superfamily ATPase